jgi:ankyrin repeat protein
LLRNQAKINHQDKLRRTALHWACRCNQVEMAGALLRLGADTDLVDFDQKKAFDLALDSGHKDLVIDLQQYQQQQNKKKA